MDILGVHFVGILDALDVAGIQIASATYEIVGLPPLRIEGGTPSR